ncbi:hypothetical protein Poly30_34830 [Planctomycetes bacterium Poly30]|uniref:Uncharacterized protein n=1 Tax=Saltatorellus ferox TaxID=2528018 RepID=A0A518EV27_9BACT|nr:hypothetical protein Poly30_34830 [Planctomycetes bacterium Poly30]
MKTSLRRPLILAAAGSIAAATASAQITLITDNFETNSSADYTVAVSAGDGAQDFSFDYVAAGIPAAPRSAVGDTKGLRLTVNTTQGNQDAATCFHNTAITADVYRLRVDVWNNFTPGGTGTTEHAHVGVGGDGATFNQIFSPISGSGAFIGFDGDGDSGSDYRWFRDPNNTPVGETDSTTLPNTHPSYLGNGSNNTGAFFQALFPAPPSTVAGSPGNIWTTVDIEVDNTAGLISFYFDGTLTYQGSFANRFDGLASLGLADVFTSVGDGNQFVVFDNFEVVAGGGLGSSYCSANANSTGVAGAMSATGAPTAAANDLTLTASSLPNNSFGFFIVSPNQGFVMNPGGSSGNLCLSGAIGRYVGPGQIQNTLGNGGFSLVADLTAIPSPTGPVATNSGDTWNFQGWFRDSSPTGPTSNFTNGLSITFQ